MIPLFFTLSYFNSHAHVERDFFSLAFNFHEVDFNSHAHVERDSSFVTPILACSSFQLTRSRGAWPGSFFSYRNEDGYFNSHAHVERDRTVFTVKSQSSISTHTLTWSVTIADCKCSVISYISTHTLTWSVTTVRSFLALSIPFQLTRSRGAWPGSFFSYRNEDGYFNSHAHVERDRTVFTVKSQSSISTHTLTWSVTIADCKCSVISYISTHTLTWSVTTVRSFLALSIPFQLTRSRGAWRRSLWHCIMLFIISTHTLTWSVTSLALHQYLFLYNFNSHAHVERDCVAGYLGQCIINFNSHAHVERDILILLVPGRNPISTHTLTWSVTVLVVYNNQTYEISTHTLTWSVT